jgi:hypothetical protein
MQSTQPKQTRKRTGTGSECLQVYHYDGVKKSCGRSALNPELDVGEDEAYTVEEASMNTSSDEVSDLVAQAEVRAQEQVQYELVAPTREGRFFEGTIKQYDDWAHAFFIMFDDGDSGWFQLWCDGELFELL